MSLVSRAPRADRRARASTFRQPATAHLRGRKRLIGLAVAAPAALALALPGAGGAAVSAPHFVNVFPSRDFVHIEGYTPDENVTVTVHHDPALVTSLSNKDQDASASGTVGADGIFEINHVGGACWSGFTPDIRPGDTVTIKDTDTNAVLDSMVVQNVTGGRPVQTAADTLQVHGTAQNADGTPPDLALLGSRLIAPERFAANGGKRNLNAPSVTYDGPGSTHWTATYAGLSQADIDTALAADTSATWTVSDAAGNPLEGTAHETGANAIAGPTAGCNGPLEKVQVAGSETTPPSVPGPLAATVDVNKVTLKWTEATDASGVQSYSVFRDAGDGKGFVEVATVQNADASVPAPTDYVDQNVPAGTYTYEVVATDAANNDGPPSKSNPVTTSDNPAPVPTVPVNDPPSGTHSIIGFPARDFISADGYADAAKVSIFVIRKGNIVASAEDLTPQGTTGLVEVNHPGGGCWAGDTPFLLPGDVLQTVSKDANGNQTVIDRTTVADVTAQRPVQTSPGTVEIHGTAAAADGSQIPVDQLENRLITSSANPFSINGKRAIRASSTPGTNVQGRLAYDSATSNRWTAKYTGLSPDDVTRALGAESRGMWLGRNPATTAEGTVFENGDQVAGGPGAPCTGQPAARPKVTLGAASLDFGSLDAASTTNGSVTKDYTITNSGDAPLKVDQAYIAGADPGSFKITKNGCDGSTVAVGAGCTVSVTFDPTTAGPTTANLNFADNTNIVGFQNVPLKGTGTTTGVTVSPAALSFNTVTAGTPVTKTMTVTNTGSAPVTIAPTITGAAAGDFTVDATAPGNCATVAAGASCTIAVKFNPTAAGSRTATLTFDNGAGAKAQVPLSGSGVGSAFSLSPSPASFGTINRNTTKSQTITVRNTGTVAFKVTAAKTTANTVFTVPAGQACVGTTLQPGKTCNLTVNFRPTAAQAYTDTLEVSGDASSLPATVKATLNGAGK